METAPPRGGGGAKEVEGENVAGSKAHLEYLYLLQDQLLCLQVVTGQHYDFLNCPLVCGPQYTSVSCTSATSHTSSCQQPLRFPSYSLSHVQQRVIPKSTDSTVFFTSVTCVSIYSSLNDVSLCFTQCTHCHHRDKPLLSPSASFLP